MNSTQKRISSAHLVQAIRLSDVDSLAAFSAALPLHRPAAQIYLNVSQLSEDEKSRWEMRLTALYPACGCAAGTVGLLVALFGSLAMGHLSMTVYRGPALWLLILAGLVACVAATGSGKLVGLVIARTRLRRALRALIKELSPPHGLPPNPMVNPNECARRHVPFAVLQVTQRAKADA